MSDQGVVSGSPAPTATYRLQINGAFTFDDAADVATYLSDLGVSHAYLSPVLEPAPGSTHGYDVVDHSLLNTAAGGRAGFERMIAALHEAGLSAVADVVPNHMAVPTPLRLNSALWSVLRDGPGSPFARWFDVDWSVEHRAILMPVLGQQIGTVLDSGELVVERPTKDLTDHLTDDLDGGSDEGPDGEAVLRYHDHVFPLRPGTEDLPLDQLVDRQWYRLAWWRVGAEELNYRRFFDVDTLAAIRCEVPEVFDATHALLLQLVADGSLTGLRIDHPDGLADPAGYLDRLAEASGGTWVVVEKILEGHEQLPADWACAGTSGYDSLHQVAGLFADSAAVAPLSALLTELTGDSPDFAAVVEAAKREVVEGSLYAEVVRLVDLAGDICREDVALRDHTRRQLHLCLVELLVAFDRYRAYVVPGRPVPQESLAAVEAACLAARARLPEHAWQTLDLLHDLVLDQRPAGHSNAGVAGGLGDGHGESAPPTGRDAALRAEFVVRFQQTCGPVMAKGVEDTAFYRWHRLVALNEVGGDPSVLGVAPDDFHAFASRLHRDWPTTMTTLSTHDTKRSEDVRARLLAMTELTAEWAEAAREWTETAAVYRTSEGPASWPDPAVVYLLWQTLIGTWDDEGDGPIAADRLLGYLEKATREAKQHTSWTQPEPVYDEAVASFARSVLGDEAIMNSVGRFCAQLAGPARVAVLGQKLVQLTMPGVPDVYQGCELVDLSLVDPDNRRPVDHDRRRALLRDLGHPDLDTRPDVIRPATPIPASSASSASSTRSLSAEKLLVTTTALRLRRARPEAFIGAQSSYTPLATTTGNALAFARGVGEQAQVVTVVTRLPVALQRRDGWGTHTITLPAGRWRDLLTPREFDGDACLLAELLVDLPVALLVRV